jgi:hypothetical protein
MYREQIYQKIPVLQAQHIKPDIYVLPTGQNGPFAATTDCPDQSGAN